MYIYVYTHIISYLSGPRNRHPDYAVSLRHSRSSPHQLDHRILDSGSTDTLEATEARTSWPIHGKLGSNTLW